MAGAIATGERGLRSKVQILINQQTQQSGGKVSHRSHKPTYSGSIPEICNKLRDRAEVAREAHNLEVGGSNPSPVTNY
jgi:hypothetical protein